GKQSGGIGSPNCARIGPARRGPIVLRKSVTSWSGPPEGRQTPGHRRNRNIHPHYPLGGRTMAVARSDDGSERQTALPGPATRKKPTRKIAEPVNVPSGAIRLDDLYRLP